MPAITSPAKDACRFAERPGMAVQFTQGSRSSWVNPSAVLLFALIAIAAAPRLQNIIGEEPRNEKPSQWHPLAFGTDQGSATYDRHRQPHAGNGDPGSK
jgi:hypothetical protein